MRVFSCFTRGWRETLGGARARLDRSMFDYRRSVAGEVRAMRHLTRNRQREAAEIADLRDRMRELLARVEGHDGNETR